MNSKKFISITAIITAVLLICISIPIIIIDPFLHYHKPLENMIYKMEDPWYINYGFIKNFEYDAMILGTSMTANFKTSEADELFGFNSIKTTFEGASFNELGKAMREACEENGELKTIICGLDMASVYLPADYEEYSNKPEYLYDDYIINDVPYLFNKEILIIESYFNVINYTNWGTPFNFDDYRAWYPGFVYSKEEVLKRYTRPDRVSSIFEYTDATKEMVIENITRNLIQVAADNPDKTFYYFYTPYSILYYDSLSQRGMMDYCINAFEDAAELLLEYDNIKLFSFCDMFDMICDFNNYKDYTHYGHHINSLILRYMKNDVGLLTKDNYKQHFESMRQFYPYYDYESIFQ